MKKLTKELASREAKIFKSGSKYSTQTMTAILQSGIENEKHTALIGRRHAFFNYLSTHFYEKIEERQLQDFAHLMKKKIDPGYSTMGSSILKDYKKSTKKALEAIDIKEEISKRIDVAKYSKEKFWINQVKDLWEQLKRIWNPDQINRKKYDYKTFEEKKNEVLGASVSYFKVYNQALENLVEGQREVVHNQDFVFEDGTTVKERVEKLRNRLQRLKSNYDFRGK